MNVSHIDSAHLLNFNYNKTKIYLVTYLNIKVPTLTVF